MRFWVLSILLQAILCLGATADDPGPWARRFAAIEQQVGGHLGVAVLDTGSGRTIEYRATERFPMCSTFKFLLAAAILQGKDQHPLARQIPYGAGDLLEWAPITRKHVQEGEMTIGDLCAAAIDYSDNTAANLLLREIGGPANLTKYVRSMGDEVTRIDRTEPSLNSCEPGDERDTTTPQAMVSDLKLLLLGDALNEESRRQLDSWLQANTTGTKRIRAGLSPDWRIGDKTGTGENGTAGDVAMVRPPGRAPILLAIYLTQSSAKAEQMDQAIAQAASVVAGELGRSSGK